MEYRLYHTEPGREPRLLGSGSCSDILMAERHLTAAVAEDLRSRFSGEPEIYGPDYDPLRSDVRFSLYHITALVRDPGGRDRKERYIVLESAL